MLRRVGLLLPSQNHIPSGCPHRSGGPVQKLRGTSLPHPNGESLSHPKGEFLPHTKGGSSARIRRDTVIRLTQGNQTIRNLGMIEARNLTRRYGDKTAVDNLSFTVERGRVTGFLGPNGAGAEPLIQIAGRSSPPTGDRPIGACRAVGSESGADLCIERSRPYVTGLERTRIDPRNSISADHTGCRP
jgi:ABC-type molybdenum transport system ATPase subunit/photorepair protein PhrA